MYERLGTPNEIRNAMQTLRNLDVAKVKVHFSGGNDEGGADGVDFFDAAGEKVTGLPEGNAYAERDWDSTTRTYGPATWTVYVGPTWKDRRPATDEEVAATRLHEILASPIYSEYGTFAGEFYVEGTCTWDVATGKYEMHGHYESRSWEEF